MKIGMSERPVHVPASRLGRGGGGCEMYEEKNVRKAPENSVLIQFANKFYFFILNSTIHNHMCDYTSEIHYHHVFLFLCLPNLLRFLALHFLSLFFSFPFPILLLITFPTDSNIAINKISYIIDFVIDYKLIGGQNEVRLFLASIYHV